MRKFGKVLITGGAGFIGTNLITRIRERGLDMCIRVIDNEAVGKRSKLSDLDVEFVSGDIREQSLVREALNGVDQVVHLAADTGVLGSIEDPVHNFHQNVARCTT